MRDLEWWRIFAVVVLVLGLVVWCLTLYTNNQACNERGGSYVRTAFFFKCIDEESQ